MMDSVFLLVTGLLMAFVSWAVWSYFGSDTPSIIVTLVLIGVAADNFRLRRQLRAKDKR
jgi:uncharacterized membrane protein YfcA